MKDELRGEQIVNGNDAGREGVIIVKKYANRRLYNTALSCYITLDDLAAMVRSGQDFLVQDAKTGADLTRSVLTQIIFEQESRGGPLLPVSFLRQLIRMYGDALQGYVPGYLEMTMAAFERNQETFRTQLERSFGQTPGYAQLDAMTRANMEMFRKALGMFAAFASNGGAEPGHWNGEAAQRSVEPETAAQETAAAASESESGKDAQIAELQRQIAEVQRKVDDIAAS